VELSVINVLMASDAMGRDDVSDWAAIHGEQQRTKYGSLGYSHFQGGFRRPMLPEFHELCPVLQIRVNPGKRSPGQTLRTLCATVLSVSSQKSGGARPNFFPALCA